MGKYRRGRINDAMASGLSEILREVKDPRINEALVSITAVEVTPDLKYAKVYFSNLLGDTKQVQLGLTSAQGFLRRKIAERLNLRITPELTFSADKSIEYGAHISELLHKVDNTKPADDGE